MKYQEIIDEIEDLYLKIKYKQIEIEGHGIGEIQITKNNMYTKLGLKLLNAEDLNITHNEFYDLDEASKQSKSLTGEELEQLIYQKKDYIQNLTVDRDFFLADTVWKFHDEFINESIYKTIKMVKLLEKELTTREKQDTTNAKVTITKKIAFLHELGLYDTELLKDKSNSVKAKISQLIIGGDLDTLTRNIKNLNSPTQDIDPKYGAYNHKAFCKKEIEKILNSHSGKK